MRPRSECGGICTRPVEPHIDLVQTWLSFTLSESKALLLTLSPSVYQARPHSGHLHHTERPHEENGSCHVSLEGARVCAAGVDWQQAVRPLPQGACRQLWHEAVFALVGTAPRGTLLHLSMAASPCPSVPGCRAAGLCRHCMHAGLPAERVLVHAVSSLRRPRSWCHTTALP